MSAVADLDTMQPMPLLVDDEPARGLDSSRKLPVPMLPSEIVRIETAMYFGQVSDKTIRIWAQKYGIGRQAEKHSPLQISFPALLMKLDGELATLDRLRAGDRMHPAVAYYLERAISLFEECRRPRRPADHQTANSERTSRGSNFTNSGSR